MNVGRNFAFRYSVSHAIFCPVKYCRGSSGHRRCIRQNNFPSCRPSNFNHHPNLPHSSPRYEDRAKLQKLFQGSRSSILSSTSHMRRDIRERHQRIRNAGTRTVGERVNRKALCRHRRLSTMGYHTLRSLSSKRESSGS